MRIAISSEGKEETSKISEVSGRAPYYLIYEDGKLVKTIKNPFAVGGGGAGTAVAEMLGDEGVDIVISGRFGEKMKNMLKSKEIKYKEVSGITVKEALAEAE
jgi:predicted Fe-Mo cluster-binding NifX family protein